LTIIIREVEQGEDQTTNGRTVFRQILINAKLQIGKKGNNNRADWEKSVKVEKIRIGL
jgi:hypothetical protein